MKVSIIGYGTMGIGIAQLFAENGHEVHIVGYDIKKVEKAKKSLLANLKKLVKKKKLNAPLARAILNNIHPCLGEDCITKSNLIIEAVPEDPKLKQNVIKKWSKSIKPTTIIATNTSSLSISELAKHCKKPERFIGFHFFNPTPVMPLVEIIKGKKTSTSTYNKIKRLAKSLGKQSVTSKDYPGFITNSLLIPFLNDSINLLHKKVASKEDIDKSAKLGLNHPMGPLELSDFIGLDVVLGICKELHKKLGARYKPSELLVKMVKQKKLGRKTKQGFYKY